MSTLMKFSIFAVLLAIPAVAYAAGNAEGCDCKDACECGDCGCPQK
jgi:hypothetical protein